MSVLLCVIDGRWVRGVTQLHNVVYIVYDWSSVISRFNAVSHRRFADITVRDMNSQSVKRMINPCDIAACQQTAQLYVADNPTSSHAPGSVWRVSSDGEDVNHLLPKSPWDTTDTINPHALSVTSSRLLVTSYNQLIQFDAVGDELCRFSLSDPQRAVESPTGTFIVSHKSTRLKQWRVSEVNTRGRVLRQFSGSRLLPLGYTPHVAVDSQGNIFVADWDRRQILLLNSELALRRVIIDEHQLNDKIPWRLCYNEQSRQLLVGFVGEDVAVFAVIRRHSRTIMEASEAAASGPAAPRGSSASQTISTKRPRPGWRPKTWGRRR